MDKVTIYKNGMFGYTKTEATKLEVTVKPYAQYTAGVFVSFVPKGKRKARCFVEGYKPSTVVLEGWGHPEPGEKFNDLGDGSKITKHLSCSPEWQIEFDAMMAIYLATSGATVLHDFREHNASVAA